MWMSEKQWKNVFPFQSGYFGVTGRTGFVCDYKPCVWISVLTGAAVCPCQRDHRGHGGGHPEDVPQCQWPQTWGEQQSVFVFTVCTLTRCSVSLTGFQYITLQLTYRLLSTRICHCDTLSFPAAFPKSPLIHASHSSFLDFLHVLLASHFRHLWFNLWSLPFSSIRWQSLVPQTCSKFTGSSCLCGL